MMRLDLDKGLLNSILAVAALVEARDPYTGGHLWRVAQFSRMLGEKAGLSNGEVFQVSLGGYLHDLGKVGVPDEILNKPGRLTAEEYAVIKTHPQVGQRAMAPHPMAPLAMDHILSHHERPDGKGYPHNLEGEQVPYQARIVGIADAFDAMTSTRPYRTGMAIEKALAIIEAGKGTQFDAALADDFLNLGKAGALAHIVGHSSEGMALAECPVCGPILALSPDTQDGDKIYCTSCTGELQVHRNATRFETAPTGQLGDAQAMIPMIETASMREILDAVPGHIHLPDESPYNGVG
ncbi:MAG: HD domain-containing protein [Magnetovibrio sp.]|nr:HD domain-containing protein [Magnetovibrio sp.]